MYLESQGSRTRQDDAVARTIVTTISEAVAETIVDLGIDWGGIETLHDLQTGLRAVTTGVGRRSDWQSRSG